MNNKIIFSFTLILSPIILAGCFPWSSTDISVIPWIIPEGHARLKATIISVDSSKYVFPDTLDPCSKSPCFAVVKIDSVEGFGAGSKPVKSGDVLKVKFALTLNPISLPPNPEENLPGLKENEKFRADFETVSGSGNYDFNIYKYVKN